MKVIIVNLSNSKSLANNAFILKGYKYKYINISIVEDIITIIIMRYNKEKK